MTTVSPPIMTNPLYADEEVRSNYGYPREYALKPPCEQLVEFSKYFHSLNIDSVLARSKELSILPAGAERWFALPRWERVANTYNEAVGKVFAVIGKTQTFYNYHKGQLGPKYLKLSERTAIALQMLGEKQKDDFLFVPAQFGFLHRGKPVRRVRIVYAPNEFGLGSFIVACMILSHPERLVQGKQLHVDCPGDEYSPNADGRFEEAPIFLLGNGEVRFGSSWIGRAAGYCGSASGFTPQQLL